MEMLPLPPRLGTGGGGGCLGFFGSFAAGFAAGCCSGYSRTNFLMYSISRSTTSLPTVPSKFPRRAVQEGSTPLDVNPDSASYPK